MKSYNNRKAGALFIVSLGLMGNTNINLYSRVQRALGYFINNQN